jgi:hypothetical protein
MPKDQDLKRLVRLRMDETGERYTTARAGLLETFAERDEEQVRQWVVDLDVPERAGEAFRSLKALPSDAVLAAATEGTASDSWRVRRACCRLLDDLPLTQSSVDALERCTSDPHPRVRSAALHSLGCDTCKPDGCALDMIGIYRRTLQDPSRLVRKGVVGTLTWKYTTPWAIELLEGVARNDPSQTLRSLAESGLAGIARRLEADERRRSLPPDVLAKTERHPGRWIAIKDGRIVAAGKGVRRGARGHGGAELYFNVGDGTYRF